MSIKIVAKSIPSNGMNIADSVSTFVRKCNETGVDKEGVIKGLYALQYGYNNKIYQSLDGVFGENIDRLTWKYEPEGSKKLKDEIRHSMTYHHVESALMLLGFKITDYIEGICKKLCDDDTREYKIGKVLSRNKDNKFLIDAFSNQPERQAKNKKYCVTLSRNPYDIITMSTFRGWSSCMNISRDNFNYVIADVSSGTLIVYMHEESDVEIEHPSGRVLLKPYISNVNSQVKLFYGRERDSYGTYPDECNIVVDGILSKINSVILKKDTFVSGILNPNLYRDSIQYRHNMINPDAINESNISTIDLSSVSNRDDRNKIVESFDTHDIFIHNTSFYGFANLTKIKDLESFYESLSTKDKDSIETFLNNDYNRVYAVSYMNKFIDDVNKFNISQYIQPSLLVSMFKFNKEKTMKLNNDLIPYILRIEEENKELFTTEDEFYIMREIFGAFDDSEKFRKEILSKVFANEVEYMDMLLYHVRNNMPHRSIIHDYKNEIDNTNNLKLYMVLYSVLDDKKYLKKIMDHYKVTEKVSIDISVTYSRMVRDTSGTVEIKKINIDNKIMHL